MLAEGDLRRNAFQVNGEPFHLQDRHLGLAARMRFWWVNHKQTARQEREGGYLWSPEAEASGARSQFYDNMRIAQPGDVVFSYAALQIGRVGVVTDYAISAPKPSEFGTRGANWSQVGWLLPVEWLDAPIAVRPKDVLDRLSPLLPARHSPIQAATGNGNQKAYLAEIDRAVAELVLEVAQMTLTDLTGTTAAEPSVVFAGKLDDDVEQGINNDTTLDDTTRKQLTEARRGQGVFRRRVLDVEPVCRVTGIENPNLLRASHVKPWRACESAQERLDGHNGLMLAPHADFLFDRGLIGSEEDGHLMFSSRLAELDAVKLGLYHVQRPPPRRLSRQSAHYFHHHRAKVYLC